MLARDPAGPVIFGEVTIGLHDLPGRLAERALREVGDRVRKEVSSAGKQIGATRTILDMPEAFGLLVFVSPPDRIGHQSIAWLVNDIVRQSADRCKLDGLLVMETALGLGDPEGINANSFSSVWSISGRPALAACRQVAVLALGLVEHRLGFPLCHDRHAHRRSGRTCSRIFERRSGRVAIHPVADVRASPIPERREHVEQRMLFDRGRAVQFGI